METSADLSHAWQELIDQFHASERSLLEWRGDGPFDPVDLAEGYRFVLHNLRYGIDFMIESDADRPHFTPDGGRDHQDLRRQPGCRLLLHAHLREEGARYRITGNRGDACYLSIQSSLRGPDRSNPMKANHRRHQFSSDRFRTGWQLRIAGRW